MPSSFEVFIFPFYVPTLPNGLSVYYYSIFITIPPMVLILLSSVCIMLWRANHHFNASFISSHSMSNSSRWIFTQSPMDYLSIIVPPIILIHQSSFYLILSPANHQYNATFVLSSWYHVGWSLIIEASKQSLTGRGFRHHARISLVTSCLWNCRLEVEERTSAGSKFHNLEVTGMKDRL